MVGYIESSISMAAGRIFWATGAVVGCWGQDRVQLGRGKPLGRNRYRPSTVETRFMAAVEARCETGLLEVQCAWPSMQMMFIGAQRSVQTRFKCTESNKCAQQWACSRQACVKLGWCIPRPARHAQMRFKLGKNF